MNNILILYAKEFNSKSKFERKISQITKNIDDYSISCIKDYNDFIKVYFNEKKTKVPIQKIEDNDFKNITHVIIFDDGEEFVKERIFFESKNIPLRYISIPITRVINIKTNTKYEKNNLEYEYIGRGSYWGNPYSMFESGESREEVIRKFAYDFDNDMFINKKKDEVYKLKGKRLGCFCKPSLCHGDILANFLNSQDDGK